MQNIYDNKKFFNEYIEMRDKEINANNLIEKPIFKSLIPYFKDKKVIDIGCGFGDLCRLAVEDGARKVVGVDISKNMLEKAKEINSDSKITYLNKPMEKLNEINEKFDFVLSSLAFHYVEDFSKLIKDIKNLLVPGGYLIFSQEHPVETAFMPPQNKNIDKKIDIEGKRYYLLSDYNNVGKRSVRWNVDGVIKYHRNFSVIINSLAENGFFIEKLIDSYADEEAIKLEPKYKYQNDRPYFLFIKAKLL